MKTLLLSAACLAASATLAAAGESRFQSGPARTALVELYTSEGCSSCPPAEAWMSRLKGDSGLWKNFVPVAFHVDYWDRLGWRDRFSLKEWTQRQGRYASLWQSESVYTPAVVLNGKELRGWSSASFSKPNETPAGVLSASTSDGKSFAVEFKPATGDAADWEAHLALLASDISSKIGAGENSGRNLKHDFVVLDLRAAPMKSEAGTQRATVNLPATTEQGRPAVAIWVTRRSQLEPVQAVGGWLAKN